MDFSDPSGALRRYQQSLTGGRSAYDQALAQQLATMQQPVDRRGALMKMAQGFLSPTKTGAFAENVGMAVGNYADANDKMREQEMDRAMKLAQIQAARAKLQMEGAGQDFDLFSKGQSMMQEQRRQQAGLDFDGSIGNVARQAMEGIGEAMPSLPGSPMNDPAMFAPTLPTNLSAGQPINDPAMFSPNPTLTPQQTQRFGTPGQPVPDSEPQPDLPARATPGRGASLQPAPDAMEMVAAADGGQYTQLAPSGGFSPGVIPPTQMIDRDRVLRNDQIPQPQQTAPQQARQAMQQQQQPSPASAEGRALAHARQTIEALHSPQGAALQQADPQGWAARKQAALETLNKFATTDTRNFTAAQNDPAFLDFLRQQAEAKRPQTTVNVPQIGSLKPGERAVYDADGKISHIETIPGGELDREQRAEAARLAARQTSQQRAGQTVLRAVTRSLDDFLPNVVSGDGPVGANARAALATVRGTAEYNLLAQIEDFRSNIGLDRLQQMREESPTGGALGQVPFQQQTRLERVLGDFDIAQPLPILEENLKQLNNIYLDIMFGSSVERAEAVSQGRMSPEQSAEIEKRYYETQFDEFGRRREGADSANPVPAGPRIISVEPVR